ncbi:MAG: hypothetical protein WCT77_01920 [Bacteroidota bacterium]
MIKQFDRTNLKVLRQEIDNALASVAKKHQIALSLGAISFSGEEFHTKLQAVIQSGNASGMSVKEIQAIKNVKTYGDMYNVKETDLNKMFTYAGKSYKFVGLMPSRPKYPVVGQDVRTGKKFKFGEEVLTKLAK